MLCQDTNYVRKPILIMKSTVNIKLEDRRNYLVSISIIYLGGTEVRETVTGGVIAPSCGF